MSTSKSSAVSGGVRLTFALLIGGAALLFARSLAVDLPSMQGWRPDETPPHALLENRPRERWPARYPPLHRDLLTGLLATARAVGPSIFATPEAYRWHLWLLGRGLTLAMALATLGMLWRLAREHAAPAPALLAPLLWALSPPVDFLARTMNLDVPYTFWFVGSLWAWLRMLERRTVGWSAAFAALAAMAILTKDQAFALYVLPSAAWIAVLVREHRSRTLAAPAAVGRTLADRRLWIPVAIAVALAAIEYRLWRGLGQLDRHLAAVDGDTLEAFRQVGTGIGGLIALLGRLADAFGVATGPVTLVAAAAGIAIAARDPKRRASLTLLLFVTSYFLFFVVPVGYVYDRFLVPVLAVLALFAPLACTWVSAPRTRTLVTALVATAALAVDGRSALELSQRDASDQRQDLARLLSAPAFRRVRPLGIVPPRWIPDSIASRHRVRGPDACADLAEHGWLIVQEAVPAPGLEPLHLALRDGSLGFRRAAIFGGEPYETFDGSRAIGSNLLLVDLRLDLYRRTGECRVDDRTLQLGRRPASRRPRHPEAQDRAGSDGARPPNAPRGGAPASPAPETPF